MSQSKLANNCNCKAILHYIYIETHWLDFLSELKQKKNNRKTHPVEYINKIDWLQKQSVNQFETLIKIHISPFGVIRQIVYCYSLWHRILDRVLFIFIRPWHHVINIYERYDNNFFRLLFSPIALFPSNEGLWTSVPELEIRCFLSSMCADIVIRWKY